MEFVGEKWNFLLEIWWEMPAFFPSALETECFSGAYFVTAFPFLSRYVHLGKGGLVGALTSVEIESNGIDNFRTGNPGSMCTCPQSHFAPSRFYASLFL